MLDSVINGDTPHDRLRAARLAAGYTTVLQFCRQFNLKSPTYYAHESGHRTIDAKTATLYGRLFGVDPSAILYGKRLSATHSIPIVAIVGAGGKISTLNDEQVEVASHISLRTADELVGLLVQGNDLYPAFQDGDLVFHRRLNPDHFDPLMIHGRECVVQLITGEKLLRVVTMQPDNRCTLIAYAAPPMINAEVVAAEPIEIIQRNTLRR